MATIKTINTVAGESIKTTQGVAGASIKNVAGIGAAAHGEQGGDAFKSEVEASDDLAAWWSPNGASAGNLADGATAMSSMYGTNPDFKIVTASTGNWKHVADDPGGEGAPDSLKTSVATSVQAKTDYCALDNAVPLSSDLAAALNDDPHDTTISGFVFFKMKDTSPDFSYQDILQFSGLINTGTGSDDQNTKFIGTWAGDKAYIGGIKQVPGSVLINGTLSHSVWYYLAFATNGDAMLLYQVKADGSETWDDVVTLDGDNTSNGSYVPRDGLSMGRNSSHGAQANADVYWGPIGIYKANLGVGEEGTTLRTIFEAAIQHMG